MATCNCMGPQNGQPLCPCRMRAIAPIDWHQALVDSTRLVGEFMEWRPIETATKDRSTSVLLWFPFREPGTGCIMIGRWGYPSDDSPIAGPCWCDDGDFDPLGEPTHWMPLPEPPHVEPQKP